MARRRACPSPTRCSRCRRAPGRWRREHRRQRARWPRCSGPHDEIGRGASRDATATWSPANINSRNQTVIGGATDAVEHAVARFNKRGHQGAVCLPVSHAFHTEIVAPARDALRRVLGDMQMRAARASRWSATSTASSTRPRPARRSATCSARQIASPVQFVKGLETCYREGARVFVEVGPKRVLAGFAEDVLGEQRRRGRASRPTTPSAATLESFPTPCAACTPPACAPLAAARGASSARLRCRTPRAVAARGARSTRARRRRARRLRRARPARSPDFLAAGHAPTPSTSTTARRPAAASAARAAAARRSRPQPAAQRLGRHQRRRRSACPGASGRVFDDDNFDRILRGECFIDADPRRAARAHGWRRTSCAWSSARRRAAASRPSPRPPRCSSSPASAARFDLVAGVRHRRASASRPSTSPRSWRSARASRPCATPASRWCAATAAPPAAACLPDRWVLPESMADETGVIFASAFPGYDRADRRGRALPRGPACASARRARGAARRLARRRAVARRAHRRARGGARRGRLPLRPHASSSTCSRWATRSSPSCSARAAPTPRSTRPAPRPPRRWPSPRTGSAPAAAAASSWSSADDVTIGPAARLDRRGLPRHAARPPPKSDVDAGRAAVRPPPQRHDHRHGRVRPGRRVRGRGARARHARHRRGARRRDRQQRLPRHAPRRRATSAQVMERLVAARRARARPRPRRDGAARRSSSRTRPTPRPAAAAPRPRSTRCAGPSAPRADAIVIANTKGFTGHPMGVGHRGRGRR